MPDRQRIIGSPAPQAYRQLNERHRHSRKKNSTGEFPTITLSAAESEDEDDDHSFNQRDSVIEVGTGGGKLDGHRSDSRQSSLSLYSVVEMQRSLSMSSSNGLTPPPRVISLRDQEGNQMTTEWMEDTLKDMALDTAAGSSWNHHQMDTTTANASDREVYSKSSLPSLGSSGSKIEIPSKYPTLDPIQSKERQRSKRSRN